VVRRGRRAGRSRLVLHVLPPEACADRGADARRHGLQPGERQPSSLTAPTRERSEAPRVGFVVSRTVGTAVIRHRVARRLRHLMRDRIAALPAGTLVVVRALPLAATASSRDLDADLNAAFRKLRMLARDEHPPMDSH
jgi:ribonuclease P protein component